MNVYLHVRDIKTEEEEEEDGVDRDRWMCILQYCAARLIPGGSTTALLHRPKQIYILNENKRVRDKDSASRGDSISTTHM